MIGNGKFFVGSEIEQCPIRLQIREGVFGLVNLIASLPDGEEVCIAAFVNGLYHPYTIDPEVAARFGIELDTHNRIYQSNSDPN